MSFYVPISDAVFLFTSFSIFWPQCLANIIILLCSLLLSSIGVVVVELMNLCWSVFVWIKLSQIGSFHELLALATECFFSFDIFERHNDAFWVFNALWVYWRFMGVLCFCFGFYVSEICHSLSLSLMRSFMVQIFFNPQDIVWLVKSTDVFLFVIFINCRSEFALRWFLLKNSCHTLVVSTRFWSWPLNVFSFDVFELYSDAFWGC